MTKIVSFGALIDVLMSTYPNAVPIPSREQFGLPSTDETRRNHDIPTQAVAAPGVIPTGQLDWIMSTLAKLESRMAAADQQAVTHRFPNRPDPDPRYAVPLSSTVTNPQLHHQPFAQTVTDHQFQPQPLITPIPHLHDAAANYRQHHPGSLPVQPPLQYNPTLMYAADPLGQHRPYHSHIPPSHQMFPPYGHPPLVDAGFHPPHTQPPDPPDWQQPYRPYDWGAHAARQPDAYQPYKQPTCVDGQPYTWTQPPRQYTTSTFAQPPYSSEARLVQHGHGATSAFGQEPYTAQTTLAPLRASFVDHQGSLTEYHINEKDENRDGVRTMVDDNFIDGVGVDLAHRYGSDNEHSSSHASRAEEGDRDAGDGDAEINEIFTIGEEGEVLADDPPPPATISLPCNPGIGPVLVSDVVLPHTVCILAKVLKQDQIWTDHTKFDDIFDADHFILYSKTATSGYYNWTGHLFAFDSGGNTSMLFVAHWFPP